jgi:carbonic anhydrase/acetyltransferase-like protein (isoleucine patch superfamily)
MTTDEIKNEDKALTPKYKLGESKEFQGRTLFRIIALRNFGAVTAGDIGGWIETEDNLSHSSNAWVNNEAAIYGSAKVYEDAQVYDSARVWDNAVVYGSSMVYGNAGIAGKANVFGNAQISGNAHVYGKAHVYGYTKMSGYVVAYDNVRIFDDAWITGNIQIYGGAIVTKAVNTIFTDQYNITITDNYLTIGCENHPIEDWEAFTDAQISKMDTEALKWWKVWKPIIFTIIKAY